MSYRDGNGWALQEYPRPSVAVDTAVLTVSDAGELCVLVLPDSDRRARGLLPGTFLHEGERLADAVLRSLREKVGVRGLEPRQLHVFDDPARDDRGWVLSVAHYDVVRRDRLPPSAMLVPVDDLPALGFDHEKIIDAAVVALREEYAAEPDPRALLDEPFPLRELRRVHEAVVGETLQPDTFRRAMLPGLVATGDYERSGRGRPAELYRRIE